MTDRQFLNRLLKHFFTDKNGKAEIRESAILNRQALIEQLADEVQEYAQRRIDSGEGFEEFT